MFRRVTIAIAAAGLLACCAHSRETETTTEAERAAAREDGYAATTYGTPAPAARDRDDYQATRDTAAAREVREKRAEARTEVQEKREPDNTAVNKRDRKDTALTPMDQGNGTDLKITQEIRKAVVGADGLSFTAKNVKIITRDANVTLRGPVKTSSEKARIDELARGCAGVAQVDNQLEVESTN